MVDSERRLSVPTISPDARYRDGTYLAHHPGWHLEDAPWKAGQVEQILARQTDDAAGGGAGGWADTVFEVGCGAGGVLAELAKRHPERRFVGYDISPDAAQFWPTHAAPNLRFEVADLNAAVDPERPIELLLALDVFEHIPDYLGFLGSLAERCRRIVFNVPLDMNVISLLLGHHHYVREHYGHLHYFSRQTALRAIADSGFDIIDQHLAPGFLGAPAESARATGKQRAIAPLRHLAHRLSPRLNATLFGGESLVVYAGSRHHAIRHLGT